MVSVSVNGEAIETFENMDEALRQMLMSPFEDENWPNDVVVFTCDDGDLPAVLVPVKIEGEHEGDFIFRHGERCDRYAVRYEIKEDRWCGTTINGVTHTEL